MNFRTACAFVRGKGVPRTHVNPIEDVLRGTEPRRPTSRVMGCSTLQRLVEDLTAALAPLTATALRKRCQVRNATLQATVAVLVRRPPGPKDRAGYALAR